MIRRWLPIAVGAGIVVWLAALVLLAITAEGSQRFGELYLVILLINVTGVIALLVLIGAWPISSVTGGATSRARGCAAARSSCSEGLRLRRSCSCSRSP